jgi:hypothetical protein
MDSILIMLTLEYLMLASHSFINMKSLGRILLGYLIIMFQFTINLMSLVHTEFVSWGFLLTFFVPLIVLSILFWGCNVKGGVYSLFWAITMGNSGSFFVFFCAVEVPEYCQPGLPEYCQPGYPDYCQLGCLR